MIEIVVCDDDKNDLDNAVNMLHKILENQDKNYRIRAFLSANELLRSRQNDIVNIGLHFFHKDVRPYAAFCSEA